MGDGNIEIALHDADIAPFFELVGAGRLRIHGSVKSDLPEFVNSQAQLSAEQKQDFLQLWHSEDAERVYLRDQGFVLVQFLTDLQ
jgi:hypothetical protein